MTVSKMNQHFSHSKIRLKIGRIKIAPAGFLTKNSTFSLRTALLSLEVSGIYEALKKHLRLDLTEY